MPGIIMGAGQQPASQDPLTRLRQALFGDAPSWSEQASSYRAARQAGTSASSPEMLARAFGLVGGFAGATTGNVARNVIDLVMPSWHRGAADMTFQAVQNPTRSMLMRLTKDNPSFRAVRDPATGHAYAWPANDALHADVVQKLGLNFSNRQQLQRNSFLFDRDQLNQNPDALDLHQLIKAIE